MAKIAITGLGGFIAFHLAQKLHADGHTVVGFDNFNDYYDPTLKESRAIELLDQFGIIVDKLDLRDTDGMNDWFYFQKPDIVMHLAAYAGVRHSLEHP